MPLSVALDSVQGKRLGGQSIAAVVANVAGFLDDLPDLLFCEVVVAVLANVLLLVTLYLTLKVRFRVHLVALICPRATSRIQVN